MAGFFAAKGTVWYTMQDGSQMLINDITSFASFSNNWRNDARTQLTYSIRDGELPHMISNRLYGSVDYWWTILLLNNIYDFDAQWPRSHEQLSNFIDNKYPNSKRTDIHHYLNSNGLIVDLLSLRISMGLSDNASVIDRANLDAISIEEYEVAANEIKRNIILIDPDYISSVALEYEKQMATEI